MSTCIAYTESGAICRQPATHLDVQRGGMVCDAHAPACTCPPGWPMPLHIRCPVGHESDVERHYSRCARYDPRLHSYAVWCPVPDCLGNAQARRAMRQPAGVIGQSCAWCDQLNAFTVTRCATCGHDAHRPRRQCGCPTCQARRG